MLSKNICSTGRRFNGQVQEVHVRFIYFATAFAMVASRACRHKVRPTVLPAHVTWDNVIHRQTDVAPAAILTGIIIAAEYFAAR